MNPFRKQTATVSLTESGDNRSNGELNLLPTAIVRLMTREGLSGALRAVCDTGAQVNLIASRCLKRAGLSHHTGHMAVTGIGGASQWQIQWKVCSEVYNQDGKQVTTETITFWEFPRLMGVQPDTEQNRSMIALEKGERLADLEWYKPGEVDIILGATISLSMLTGAPRVSERMLLIPTRLGVLMAGARQNNEQKEVSTTCITLAESIDEEEKDELLAALQKLWEIEEIFDNTAPTDDELWCEQEFERTVQQDSEGRYIVTIPIRPGEVKRLGHSREQALQRFHHLERQFSRDAAFHEWYVTYMRDLFQAGYLQEAPAIAPSGKPVYYIPHHGVRPPKKPRVVFDASAKTSTGVSLNDIQLTGPRLQDDLVDLIMRFRMGKVAMTADVCKMFPQVRVAEEQWDLQRIFWREGKAQELKEYHLVRITFGMASSTYNAVKAMQHCATSYQATHPLAYEAVMKAFYVDDFLSSAPTVARALAIREQLETVLDKGRFPLAKWRSNEPAIITKSASQTEKELQEEGSTSVLGLTWESQDDVLKFKVRAFPAVAKITKRVVASEGAKIYDPNGFVGPVTMRAKKFMQELWRQGIQWDEEIDECLQSSWVQYRGSLSALAGVEIPRWLAWKPEAKSHVHVFCDASQLAYGAVAYLHVEEEGQEPQVRLLASRNKLAPSKKITIPRLELCAASLGGQLAHQVTKAMGLPIERVTCWSDSEIVLHWVRRFPSSAREFVGNRISVIQKHTNVKQWRHVPSQQNPADILSRGVAAEKIAAQELWWNGPAFLKRSPDEWPQWDAKKVSPEIQGEVDDEMRKNKPIAAPVLVLALTSQGGERTTSLEQLLGNISSMRKALRVTAYVQRFVQCFIQARMKKRAEVAMILRKRAVKSPERVPPKAQREPPKEQRGRKKKKEVTVQSPTIEEAETSPTQDSQEGQGTIPAVHEGEKDPTAGSVDCSKVPPITVDEMRTAMTYWIRLTQQLAYPQEMALLKQGKPIPTESRLLQFTPFLDQFGAMRVRGRLENAEAPYEQRHPVILPGNTVLAQRLMETAHKETLHGGLQLCMQYLRAEYWITGLRTAMKRWIHKCGLCARYRGRDAQQLMADLPAPRVQRAKPFYHTGVDFAGPYKLKAHTGRGAPLTLKAYLCVFIDFPTKAVHLELVSDLSTPAFLAALDRLIARRGTVAHLYSDNGTNFQGSSHALTRQLEAWNQEELLEGATRKGIQWHFNTPLAPHHGGLWEATVKRAKYHLAREIGVNVLTFEELYTLIVRVEMCLNSRPLVALKDDPGETEALTPGHFLVGGRTIRPVGPLVQDIPDHRLDSWERIHKREQSFWQRWSDEYLVELQRRTKWRTQRPDPRVGDLAYLRETNQPPATWKRARITRVYPGKDGLIRSVQVRADGRLYDRPIHRLAIIPGASFHSEAEICTGDSCAPGCGLGQVNSNK